MTKPVDIALPLIKQFEGFRATAYQDIVGVWTIGYGRTGKDVVAGATTTQEAEDARLVAHLETLWQRIDHEAHRDLTPQQGAALISLAYNIGPHALSRSTLMGLVQDGQMGPAAEQFLRWDKARTQGGSLTVVPGLRLRRMAEKQLFLSGM